MIFYFTGTGNSLFVVKNRQWWNNRYRKSIGWTKFIYNIKNEEKFGIVFPVYFTGLSNIVSDFIKN